MQLLNLRQIYKQFQCTVGRSAVFMVKLCLAGAERSLGASLLCPMLTLSMTLMMILPMTPMMIPLMTPMMIPLVIPLLMFLMTLPERMMTLMLTLPQAHTTGIASTTGQASIPLEGTTILIGPPARTTDCTIPCVISARARDTFPAFNSSLGRATAVLSTSSTACGLFDTGKVVCWAQLRSPAVGVGSRRKRHVSLRGNPAAFVPIHFGTDSDGKPFTAKALEGGTGHLCIIRNDDKVHCWGSDSYDQIDVGREAYQHV